MYGVFVIIIIHWRASNKIGYVVTSFYFIVSPILQRVVLRQDHHRPFLPRLQKDLELGLGAPHEVLLGLFLLIASWIGSEIVASSELLLTLSPMTLADYEDCNGGDDERDRDKRN